MWGDVYYNIISCYPFNNKYFTPLLTYKIAFSAVLYVVAPLLSSFSQVFVKHLLYPLAYYPFYIDEKLT